jgi:large conductance mechanosensitive channel
MKNFIKEFKQFALKGSVVDLAVAVVIGAAFGKIVTSLVTDVITPAIGLLTGNVNLVDFTAGSFALGDLIQSFIDFIIIALCIFVAIKFISLLHKKEDKAPAPAPAPSREETLLTEIRDILKNQK